MRAIDVLREEHHRIAQLLDCLEQVLAQAHAQGHLDAGPSTEILALFEHFADGRHQQREETCLFPRLLARARSVEERIAVGRLCGEHEEERHSLRSMVTRLLGAVYGDKMELQEFLREGVRFLRLHRAHLAHEDSMLLPMAEELLQTEDEAFLLDAYAELDAYGPSLADTAARIQHLVGRVGGQPSSASEL
jgi:hemerythrin-like domain-containing protein